MAGDYRTHEPQHRVYHLMCTHCGNHLSDRGMRAVLLLRPSIVLFSTDCMPSNCGPALLEYDINGQEAVERTCTCLTQNLSCFGCGNTVGYHIIRPCSQCVQSVSQQQTTRSANGHRWVFHADEVTPRERRFIYGEPSVSVAHTQVNQTPSVSSDAGRSPLTDVRTAGGSRAHQHQSISAHDRLASDAASKLDGEMHTGGGSGATRDGSVGRRPSLQATDQRPYKRGRPSQITPGLRHGDVLFWHMLRDSGDRAPTSDPALYIRSRPAR